MSNSNELHLLEGIKKRQQSSLEAFYDKYENTVYRFALSRLNNTFDAADIVNQVMLEVWNSAHKFENRSKVTTWLLGIANHRIIDKLRKIKKNEVTVDEIENLQDDNVKLDFELTNSQHNVYIQQCLRGLKGDHKHILHLLFFNDLSYGEISQVIGCPVGTIKSRVFHAKNTMKKCVQRLLQSGCPV